MLKEVLASNTAKLVAACVCPVVGAGTVVMEVPQVRAAVHKATAAKPKRHRVARAKAPVREPKETAPDRSDERGVETAALVCSQPIHFADAPLAQLTPAPVALMPMAPPPRIERVYVPSGCGAVPVIGELPGRYAGVPEPATWLQMIAGFGLLGGAVRAGRRRRVTFA